VGERKTKIPRCARDEKILCGESVSSRLTSGSMGANLAGPRRRLLKRHGEKDAGGLGFRFVTRGEDRIRSACGRA